MKHYNSISTERIGFDFYCDIANNIVKARKEKGWTQAILAEKAGLKPSRLSQIEGLKIRIKLEDVEALAKALDRTSNWLIDAEMDCKGQDCLYLIWVEGHEKFKLYKKATSARMAFLLFDKAIRDSGVKYNSPRDRFFVKLVGVPITKEEIRDHFPKQTLEDMPLEPDKGAKT